MPTYINKTYKNSDGRVSINTETETKYLARYKAEQVFEKPLAGKHPVHHANGDWTNDKNNNLVICESIKYHKLLHKRMKKMKLKDLEKYQILVEKSSKLKEHNAAVLKNNLSPYRLKVKQNKKEQRIKLEQIRAKRRKQLYKLLQLT